MRHSISLPLLVVLAAGVPRLAAQAAPAAPVVDSAGLATTRGSYMRLFAAGDAAGLAALFAENGGLDQFGVPRMKGRAQIEAGLKAAFGMMKPVSLEIVPFGITAATNSLAAEIGIYHSMSTVNGKTGHEWGRYVTSLGRDSAGAWRLQYIMAFPDSSRTDK